MRICLISRQFPQDTAWNGLATFVHDLALGLQEIGHEVVVISLSDNGIDQCVGSEKITVHRVAWKNLLNEQQMLLTLMPHTHDILKPVIAIWQRFCELNEAQPFDVVETSELFAGGLFVGLAKAAPLVVRLRASGFNLVDNTWHDTTSNFDRDFIGFIKRFTLITADCVICGSGEIAASIRSDINYPLSNIAIASESLDDATSFNPAGGRDLERQIVAQQATILYERVITGYEDKKRFALYKSPAGSLLPSAIELITAFNSMLYNSLYVYSWRFRLNHWFHQVKDRPRLSFAKAIMRAAGGIFRLTGRETLPRLFIRLKEQIKLKKTNGFSG